MTAARRPRDLRPLILEQRARLGDLLAVLDGTEWEADSLCYGWLVRDVVAHCIQNHRAAPWNVPGQMVAAGFSLNARNQRWVERWRAVSPTVLLAIYRATADRTTFPGLRRGLTVTPSDGPTEALRLRAPRRVGRGRRDGVHRGRDWLPSCSGGCDRNWSSSTRWLTCGSARSRGGLSVSSSPGATRPVRWP